MRTVPVLFAVLVVLIAPAPGLAQPDKLGSVTFPTSCDAGVQRAFERGVAMLHSYWFTEARKVFESVLQQDSRCVMAYWGLAVNSLGNSLASAPSAKDARAASEALDRARALGARTPRERDWIEAIGAYYQNHESTPVDARLLAYTRAMEQITQRYPDDFEGWTYYALTLQASAPKQDRTYANQLKSAEILERSVQAEPRASGRRPLPGARLRLSAPGGARHRHRAPLRSHRAGGAARPAHALAHLLDGGDVARVHRVEPLRAAGPARVSPRHRLHRLRAAPARPGRAGQAAGRCRGGAAAPGVSDPRELHGGRRRPGPLCARARRLGRRRRPAGAPPRAGRWPTR